MIERRRGRPGDASAGLAASQLEDSSGTTLVMRSGVGRASALQMIRCSPLLHRTPTPYSPGLTVNYINQFICIDLPGEPRRQEMTQTAAAQGSTGHASPELLTNRESARGSLA